jgi:predicted  nucleic acid-binding Zn-ribbon protein
MSEPTTAELDDLLGLAATDAELRRLHRQLDALPEQQQLDALLIEVTAFEERRADLGLDRDAAQAEATRQDKQVDQLRLRLEAEQQRLYGGDITNAKELQSVRAEIESVERRIDEHEGLELEAMERVEQIEREVSDLETQISRAQEQMAELEAARDAAAKTILVEIAEHEVARDAQRDKLPPDMREQYDAAATRHHGVAVGELDGDRCTACGISLSYADVNGLVEGPPLTTCPNCGRLMVVH